MYFISSYYQKKFILYILKLTITFLGDVVTNEVQGGAEVALSEQEEDSDSEVELFDISITATHSVMSDI